MCVYIYIYMYIYIYIIYRYNAYIHILSVYVYIRQCIWYSRNVELKALVFHTYIRREDFANTRGNIPSTGPTSANRILFGFWVTLLQLPSWPVWPAAPYFQHVTTTRWWHVTCNFSWWYSCPPEVSSEDLAFSSSSQSKNFANVSLPSLKAQTFDSLWFANSAESHSSSRASYQVELIMHFYRGSHILW